MIFPAEPHEIVDKQVRNSPDHVSSKFGFATPKTYSKEYTGPVRKMTENAMLRTFRALGDPGAQEGRARGTGGMPFGGPRTYRIDGMIVAFNYRCHLGCVRRFFRR